MYGVIKKIKENFTEIIGVFFMFLLVSVLVFIIFFTQEEDVYQVNIKRGFVEKLEVKEHGLVGVIRTDDSMELLFNKKLLSKIHVGDSIFMKTVFKENSDFKKNKICDVDKDSTKLINDSIAIVWYEDHSSSLYEAIMK